MKIAIIGTVASSVLGFRGPLIRELLAHGHQVFAFAIDYTDEQKETLAEWGVTPIYYSLSRSGLNPIADIATMLMIKKKLQKIQPDVVLGYFVKPVVYGTLAAWLAKVPKRIAMLEGLGFAFTNQPDGTSNKAKWIKKIQLSLYRLAFPLSTDLVFLNTDDRYELLIEHRIKCNNSYVLGGIGLDFDEYSYSKPNKNKMNFLFIGRLLKEKGIFEFLSAAKNVKEQCPDCEFTILGSSDTSSPNALSTDILQYYMDEGIVNYPGQVNNVAEWINETSVFVLPSYREGVPRSSQEAMAVGRPILTTDVPGCRETVVEGVNGFLVPAFDVEKLAEKMIWFIENPNQIESMGLASRKMAEEKFDVHKVNTRMLEIMGL
jgi:glycosyltransferase involved in cell wall biosynthesis